MAAASPWWVISASTLNGQPWQAIELQFPNRAAAQAASQGGVLAGPFKTEAEGRTWGEAWSARTHHQFTDNPALSSANPVTAVTAGAAGVISGFPNFAFHLVFGNTGGLLGRALKVIIGGILLISGLFRVTGADKAAKGFIGVAGKAAVLA